MKYLNKKKYPDENPDLPMGFKQKKIAKNQKNPDFLPLFANSKRPVSAVF